MPSSSAQRQEAHRVARRDRLPGRVVDQAVGPDRRGQHGRALVGRTGRGRRRRCGARAGTRGAGRACGQSKSARMRDRPRRQLASRPAARSRNGRTNSRKVTKLDTGLPGRPMKKAASRRRGAPRRTRAACPASSRSATCRARPSRFDRRLDVVFLADRDAAAGDDQVVARGRAARSAARVASRLVGDDAEVVVTSQPSARSRPRSVKRFEL